MSLLRISLLSLSIALTMACSDSANKTPQPEDQVNKGTASSKATISVEYQPEVFTIAPANLSLLAGQSGAFTISSQAGYEVSQVSGCNATLNTKKNMILINNAIEDCKVTVTGTQVAQEVAVTSSVDGLGELLNLPNSTTVGGSFTFDVQASTSHKLASLSGCGASQLTQSQWIVASATTPCHITANFTAQQASDDASNELIKLPIVVHVLPGNTQDVSDQQIRDLLATTNNHFRASVLQVSRFSINANEDVGSDAKIQFYLATTSPDELPTNGINRVATTQVNANTVNELPIWDTAHYINVWVSDADTLSNANTTNSELAKPAKDKLQGIVLKSNSFPQSTGITTSNEVQAGVQIEPIQIMTPLITVLTHELGHYLGLPSLTPDTPKAPICEMPLAYNDSCINAPEYYNYMRENTLDKQRKAFTTEQINAMRQTLQQGELKPLYDNTYGY